MASVPLARLPDVRVAASGGGSIAGRVTASDSGLPLRGACASLSDGYSIGTSTACTDAAGAFTMTGVAPGTYTLAVRDQVASHITRTTSVTVTRATTSVADVALPPGVSVTGTVTDADTGAPLAGICVGAFHNLEVTSPQVIGYGACSDADGHYRTDGTDLGTHLLEFDAVGPEAGPYIGERIEVSLQSGGLTVDRALHRGRSFAGTITDDRSGAPLAGVCVTSQRYESYVTARCSDGNGRYRTVGLSDDRTYLTFTDPAGRYLQVGRDPDSQPTATVPMTLGGSITGTLTDLDTGAVIEGACPATDPTYNSARRTCSDQDGRYELFGLRADTTVAFVDERYLTKYAGVGYGEARSPGTYPVTLRTATTGVDDRLRKAATISGTITQAATGAVASACAELLRAGETVPVVRSCPAGDGRYRLAQIAPGDYQLKFADDSLYAHVATQWWSGRRSRATADTLSIAVGANRTIDSRLLERGSITGRITSRTTGRPVSGVSVTAFPVSPCEDCTAVRSESTSDGTYKLLVLRRGSYRLQAADPSYGYGTTYSGGGTTLEGASTVTAEDDQTTTDADIAMADAGRILGRVTHDDGTPVVDGIVTALPEPDGYPRRPVSVRTDADGRYDLGGLDDRPVIVSFSGPDQDLLTEYYADQSSIGPSTRRFTVRADERVTGIDAAVTVGGRFSGTVTERHGRTVSDVAVSLVAADGSALAGMPITTTASDGTWVLHALPAGSYRIKLDAPQGPYFGEYDPPPIYHRNVRTPGAATAVPVALGERVGGLDDQVPAAPVLRGRVTDSDTGAPIQTACVDARVGSNAIGTACTAADGSYSLVLSAPARGVSLHLRGPEGSRYPETDHRFADGTTTFDIPDDTDVVVDPTMTGAAVVTGRVTDAVSGEPLVSVCIQVPATRTCTFTDRNGRYTSSGLRPGTYRLTARPGVLDHVNGERTVTIGSSDLVVDLPLDPAGSLLAFTTSSLDGAPVRYTKAHLVSVATGATTDVDAEYSAFWVDQLPVGSYRLYVARDGDLESQWFDGKATRESATLVTITKGTQTSVTVVLRSLATGTVVGKVTSPGTSFNQTRVCGTVLPATGPPVCTGDTGDGYVLHLPPGPQVVTFQPYILGAFARNVTVPDGGTTRLDVVAPAGAALQLVVRDADDGTVLPEPCFEAYVTGIATPVQSACLGDPYRRSEPLAAGTYAIRVHAPGYQPSWFDGKGTRATATRVTIPTSGLASIETKLRRGGTVAGRVTGEDGVPVAVCLEAYDALRRDLGPVGCSSAADGSYRTEGLAAGVAYLQARPIGTRYRAGFYGGSDDVAGAAPILVVGTGGTTGIDLVLPFNGARLSGRATDASGPVAGACAQVYRDDEPDTTAAACAGADGAWAISGLQPGTYRIAIVDPSGIHATRWVGGATRTAATPTAVTYGSVRSGLDVVLPVVTGVRGVLADELGRPVPKGCVTLYDRSGTATAGACAKQADGTYVVQGIAPGSYRVGFYDPTGLHSSSWYGGSSLATARPITVVDQQLTDHVDGSLVGVTTLFGTVRDKAGRPISGACAYLYAEDATTSAGVGACTRGDGTYALQGMAPGRYVVRVSDPGGRFVAGRAPGTATAVEHQLTTLPDVALAALGSISGTITDRLGRGALGACAYLDTLDGAYAHLGACADLQGRYTIAGVPPGQYKLGFYGVATRSPTTSWWEDAADEATATVITVGDGGVVTGIDGVAPIP